MEHSHGVNPCHTRGADGGFQTEEEMLHFALEASLQGYTSPNYADYKETHSQRAVDGNSHISNSLNTAASVGGLGFAVNLGAQYTDGFDDGVEDMDEDLMRAIAESLRK